MKILLVEDEPGISSMICEGLEDAGYSVDTEEDGEKGLQTAIDGNYQLIILDVMLPSRDGWSICETLRLQRNRVPILMLTARDTVQDRVHGLDTGADDYMPKPFDFRELMARVRALIRRDKIHKSRTLRVADLEIDTLERKVRRAGEAIHLSHREYDLLYALAARPGAILTREMIQEGVWMNEDAFSNTVNVYVGMLRKKVDAGHDVKLIQTVRGIGYSIVAPGRGDSGSVEHDTTIAN